MDRIFTPELEYYLSDHELNYLYGLMGVSFALGHRSPYLGLLAEEIEELSKNAFDSLVQRKLIRRKPSGNWFVDPMINIIVETVVKSDHAYVLEVNSSDGQQECHYIHLRDNLRVILFSLGNRWKVKLKRDNQSLETDIFEMMTLAPAIGSSGNSYTIRVSTLDELIVTKGRIDSPKLDQELIACLENSANECKVLLILNQRGLGQQQTKEFGFLYCDDQLWLAKRKPKASSDALLITSMDSHEIEEVFLSYLP